MEPDVEVRRDLGPVLAPFPREQRFLLPALQAVQAELGWLPLWALQDVGEHLRVPNSELYAMATHYLELRFARPGAHVVRVCTGLSCLALGAGEVLAALEGRLEVPAGRTTEDGRVTLETIGCAFICSVAPVVEVDAVAHGGISPGAAVGLVDGRLGTEVGA